MHVHNGALRVTPLTSAPIRDAVADHLITPMDHDLLVTDIVSTVKTAKLFGVPVVHSTVMWPVAKGRLSPELGVGDVVGCPGATKRGTGLALAPCSVRSNTSDTRSRQRSWPIS